MRRYGLLVFDWDGTLSDSLQRIITAMQRAMAAMSLESPGPASIRNIVGLGLSEAVSRLYPELSTAQIARFAEHYRASYLSPQAESARLFPGVKDLLARLYEQDYLLAVATGKSRRGLERALQESNTAHFFHASRCADETLSKPHPQMLNEIMEVLAIGRQEVLMIGDSEYDLQMASNAGVSAVAVNYGAQTTEHLLTFSPLLCLDRLSDLLPWLEQYH